MVPPADALAPADDARIARFGFPPWGDLATLAAAAGRRGWDVALSRDDARAGYGCTLTRNGFARFLPAQVIGRGTAPAAALADAIVRLCDPDADGEIDAAVARAVRWRRDRYRAASAAPPPKRRHRPAAPAPDPSVAGFAYRPLASLEGRRGAWYPAGEVIDRPAGERFRVWLRPGTVNRVRAEQLGDAGDPR
ncbi:MAG: hypothetical protein AVDCRST_MAG19-2963 [uncultured Thermomicrobiales bacterium]|uniref:Uncharacterized protein n=1 Tax=uncultured Thermomicrobiales bacterium TaxID=1645740 RepID=A0A6J4VBE3_9BACT|nr:MAG: hypothetical protein AVDCRST_MAG19-2963 [uncultured Thermomicrobiales bacterium]